MNILSVPPRKHCVSHKKSECITIDSIRNGAATRTAQGRRRRTFRRLAIELAALTLASNKEILATLTTCARFVTADSTAAPSLPFKGKEEWISQITQALGTGFSAKARAALRTTILTMDTPILRERHGQLAAESPEAYVHLAVRTLPVCYLAPQHGHQSTSRILVAIFHLREQRLSLALLPLAPEWRGTSLDDLVSPQHSPLRPATIALARAAVLAALDELYDREPTECFTGAVQTAGKLSFFRKRQKFKRKLYECFGRAVCFINDENGKTRALQHTGTAAIAHIKINFGCLVDIRLDVDCFFYTGLCTGIAGDFLKTLCDGNGAL